MKLASVVVLTAAIAAAQVGVPLVGWLPEGTAVRPIRGLAAAAYLDGAASTGHPLLGTVVSPAQNFVLATAADTRQVMVIAPGVSANTLNVPASPDQAAISPGGLSAVLWYSATGRFEIVSGLPGSPVVREVDASALGAAPAALAVSDDGQWVAAAAANGAYAWGSDGSAHLLYGGADAGALSFFGGESTVAMATASSIVSIRNPGMAAVLASGTFSPMGVAVSSDRQKIVMADRGGTIYSVNVSTGATSTFDCQCRPAGVFGMTNDVFRLTGGPAGPVKLFDAAAGAILAVPRAGIAPRRAAVQAQQTTAPPLPTLTINLSPFPAGYLQQPAMTVTSSAAYSSDISGTVTLAYTTSVGGQDQTVQFSTGGTTVNFTIPAGTTTANFSGASSVTLSTGTMAGTTILTASIVSPTPVATAATQSFTTNATVPFISKVSFTTTPGVVTVVVTGFSSTRDVVSAGVTFAPSSNATINESGNVSQNQISVPVSSYFQAYYATSASYATGSEFQLTIPFSVTGNSADVVAVTVTLVNTKGASNPVSPQ